MPRQCLGPVEFNNATYDDMKPLLPTHSPGITPQDVAGLLGADWKPVKDILDRAYERGLVVRVQGSYFLLVTSFLKPMDAELETLQQIEAQRILEEMKGAK